jgi:hypothetical protein
MALGQQYLDFLLLWAGINIKPYLSVVDGGSMSLPG